MTTGNLATKERNKFLAKQKSKKIVADTLKDDPKQMKFSEEWLGTLNEKKELISITN